MEALRKDNLVAESSIDVAVVGIDAALFLFSRNHSAPDDGRSHDHERRTHRRGAHAVHLSAAAPRNEMKKTSSCFFELSAEKKRRDERQ